MYISPYLDAIASGEQRIGPDPGQYFSAAGQQQSRAKPMQAKQQRGVASGKPAVAARHGQRMRHPAEAGDELLGLGNFFRMIDPDDGYQNDAAPMMEALKKWR